MSGMTDQEYADALGLSVEEYLAAQDEATKGTGFPELPEGKYKFKIDAAKAKIGEQGAMKGAKQISCNLWVLDESEEPVKGYGRFFFDLTLPVPHGDFVPKAGVTAKAFLQSDTALQMHAGLEKGALLMGLKEGVVPPSLIGAVFPANIKYQDSDNGKRYARIYAIARKIASVDVPPPARQKSEAAASAVDDASVPF
jgi:hypothetical protein